jgi:hypothetical protein
MTDSPSLKSRSSPKGLFRGLGVSGLVLALFASQTGIANATIDNTATANGTPSSGTLVPPSATVNIPVAPSTPTLTVSKTAAAPVDVNADGVIKANDTITYTYTIQNTGNVTINSVAPLETGAGLGEKFNTVNGTGSLSAFTLVSTTNPITSGSTLAPNESGTWTAVYTLSDVDAFRAAGINPVTGNAAENTAKATGTPVTGVLGAVAPVTAEVAIPANPKMSVNKTFVFTTDAGVLTKADVGDVIKYTYTIVNTGNVAINNVSINDIHEGTALGAGLPGNENMGVGADGPLAPGTVSSDALANNGTWSVLQPGATITFTYTHTVTQAEVDAG